MFNVVFFGSNGKALASKIDVSSLLVGDGLYYGSTQLSSKTFSNEFASIVSGRYMFSTSNIKTFSGSLTSLQDGTRMFESTSSFTSFTSEMPNLSNGTYMFYNTPLLASFSSSLPNLRIGECMFQNAKILPSFSVSLPKLTNGSRMFDGCASLETFNSVLPSLENGSYMFQGCKLSGRSVRNIVESLPTYETQHSITIGINCTEDIEGQREFLRETGYNTFEEIEDALAAKGWKVVWHFQGFPSGWRPVEYLESTGTQFIDTGITSSSESSANVVFSIVKIHPSLAATVFGSYDRGEDIGRWILFTSPPGGGKLFLSFWTPDEQPYINEAKFPKIDEITSFSVNREENVYILNNERIAKINATKSWESKLTIGLFGATDNAYHSYHRIYMFNLSRAGTLQRDLVPCVDNVGNPCMYDKVSKTSLYNKGSGKFLVPTTSATYTLRQPVAEFAQLTDSGVRKLYHLPYDYEGTLEEFVEENGFKPLIENEKPEEGNWMPEWTETEDAVILNWVEAPEEIVEV